ncbi:MAG: 2-methoxy-6-polyprenyl-1,4-benzoquinol methylase, mitochondrial [Chroococcidiopsis sp. SAG 2025]|uniref:class I SAM-dependent methyltransferase n=1 Tax=Chroococcidiopsis sp. SAG 2025 TaxID=171389 RepID=UPI00293729C7|nr:class I SAM-dependent methyltransferase [Chroococcidiopsis sp. SAG 2025]MDV2994987.1 2-methoxy-6-polyprenyl-1,4-benzoquinol methylase, mitochondrial [Chroococcidiopsis sp. SAG 2025]
MAVRQDTIWEQFLAPVVRLFIDEEELKRYARSIDWEKESDRFRRPEVEVPVYYSSQNFHGIKGGYLNSGAAVSYDPITQYVLLPNETLVRQGLLERIRVKPSRIIDLGCGTGSTTLMLKQAFPQAEVIGLDLSPYMLVRAEDKAKSTGLSIQWLHGNAEETKLPAASFDLVTISLLFHETPVQVTQAILRESFRLLKVGGEAIVLDGNQQTLRHLDWLNNVFEEPYIREFAQGNLDAWMDKAGFAAVQTDDVWLVNQVTRGIKPLMQETGDRRQETEEDMVITEEWIPAPGY